MKKHLHYMDVAKGMLILMVAFGHVWYVICHNKGFDNPHMSNIHDLVNLWVSFFMPAFFVITGYCSSFDKPFSMFLVQQVKSILIPAFTLALISRGLTWFCTGSGFSLGIKTFLLGGTYWFLMALFVAKLVLYSFLRLTSSLKIILCFCIALYLIAIIVNQYIPGFVNLWCWKHAFLLLPSLLLGVICKKFEILEKKRLFFVCGLGYLVMIIAYLILGYKIPRVTGGIYVPLTQCIQCLLMSSLGAVSFLYLCRIISKSTYLESLGKNSLVIYCLHEGLIAVLAPLLGGGIRQATFMEAIIYYSLVLVYVTAVSHFISIVLNKKYISFIIGKF